jgi:hypothetical protein
MGLCEALDRYDQTRDIGIGPYAANRRGAGLLVPFRRGSFIVISW